MYIFSTVLKNESPCKSLKGEERMDSIVLERKSTGQATWLSYWGILLFWIVISLNLWLLYFFMTPLCVCCMMTWWGSCKCLSSYNSISQVIRCGASQISKVTILLGLLWVLLRGFHFKIHSSHTFQKCSLCPHCALLPGLAYIGILKAACTKDCVGQVHSSCFFSKH